MLLRSLFCLFLVIGGLTFASDAKGQENYKKLEWKSIILLQTTKTQIEKKFGKQVNPSDKYHILYKTEDYNLIVDYSYGRCADGKNSGWNIEPDIATNFVIHFKPDKEPLLSVLEPDIAKLSKVAADYGLYFANERSGILYFSPDETYIYSATYSPVSFKDSLRCRK